MCPKPVTSFISSPASFITPQGHHGGKYPKGCLLRWALSGLSRCNQKHNKGPSVPPIQSAVSCMQGESRRHQGLGTGSDVRHRLGFTGLLECKYLEFMCDTPQRSAWMLFASLPKFHFHPAILRGFQRPFVSLCHSPGKLPIWPWHRTG